MLGNVNDPLAKGVVGSLYDNGWFAPNLAANELKTRSFFCRFSKEILVRFLPFIEVRQYKPETNVYLKGKVGIVLGGTLMIRSHARDPNNIEKVAKYVTGDIIGFAEIDRGVTTMPDTWNHCINRVEVAIIDISKFRELWHLQESKLSRTFNESISVIPMFNVMSEQTKRLFLSELIHYHTFKPGKLILAQDRRSPFNFAHNTYMKNQPNVLYEAVIKEEEEDKNIKHFDEPLNSAFSKVLSKVATKVRANIVDQFKSRMKSKVIR